MSSSKQTTPLILIVDDDEDVIELIAAALRFHGFRTRMAATGTEAGRSVEQEQPDLVLLDVNLPDFDGFEVCRRFRAFGNNVPIIFLTARNGTSSLQQGFEHGADDYLTKPFRVKELILRIGAVLRRSGIVSEGRSSLVCSDLRIDEQAMNVTRGGITIALSPTEYRLLTFLATNRDNVVSKFQILDYVWNGSNDGMTTLVETYIGYLRRKIDAENVPLIHTVRGVGYVLRTPPPSLTWAPAQ
jgi:two-component system, OmpR family, response regulator